MEAESALVRPERFVVLSDGGAAENDSSSSASGTEIVELRLDLRRRLPLRRMEERTLCMEFVRLSRETFLGSPGDPGGVFPAAVNVDALTGEYWRLGERCSTPSLSLSSALNAGDQPSLKTTQSPVMTMMFRRRSSVRHRSVSSNSSSIASAKIEVFCVGVLNGVIAAGFGILYESLTSSSVLLSVAITGCCRLFGDMVLKLNFFLLASTGLLPSLFFFGTHLTVNPSPCSSVLKNSYPPIGVEYASHSLPPGRHIFDFPVDDPSSFRPLQSKHTMSRASCSSSTSCVEYFSARSTTRSLGHNECLVPKTFLMALVERT